MTASTYRALALLLLAALFLGTASSAPASETTADDKPLPPGLVEIDLEDLHCKTCAKKVARKLYALKGVRKVVSNVKQDWVKVTVSTKQPVDPVKLWKAVEAGGQQPVELRYADKKLNAESMEPLLKTAGLESAAR